MPKKVKKKNKLSLKQQEILHKQFEDHHNGNVGQYVGDLVYGALDGIITTFAVVAGSAGAGLSSGVVIVLGFANLIADGISMSVGNYLSLKSEKSYYEAQRKTEEFEVKKFPDVERKEIREIYRKKGFSGKALEQIVALITSNKKTWVDTMMNDELGLTIDQRKPIFAGLATFFAFVVAGFVPLIAYIATHFFGFPKELALPTSITLSFLTIFSVGSLRSLVIAKPWLNAGFEMLIVGGLAAVASFFIGDFLGNIIL
ncbi:MAG: VIT1/CCC1 transporter family protein [Candidatus Diapherotrites archaeon]